MKQNKILDDFTSQIVNGKVFLQQAKTVFKPNFVLKLFFLIVILIKTETISFYRVMLFIVRRMTIETATKLQFTSLGGK